MKQDEEQPALGAEPRKKVLSKWWPLACFAMAALCVVIAAIIVNSWANAGAEMSDGRIYGSIVLLVISAICKVTGWVLLFKRHSQLKRNRKPPSFGPMPYQRDTVSDLLPHTPLEVELPQPSKPLEMEQPPPQPQELQGAFPPVYNNCGTTVTKGDCPKCGVIIH